MIFISDVDAGRSTDKQMKKHCAYLDLLGEGDNVIADGRVLL